MTTPDRAQFLDIKEVCSLVHLSKAMVYALMRKNRFPRNVKLGSKGRTGAVRWDRDTLMSWMKTQADLAAGKVGGSETEDRFPHDRANKTVRTLLDEFAIAALPVLLGRHLGKHGESFDQAAAREVAFDAYMVAETMLAERAEDLA